MCWVFAASRNTKLRNHKHTNSSTTPSSSHRANTPSCEEGRGQLRDSPPRPIPPGLPSRASSSPAGSISKFISRPGCRLGSSAPLSLPDLTFFFKPHLADGSTAFPLNPIEQLEAFSVIVILELPEARSVLLPWPRGDAEEFGVGLDDPNGSLPTSDILRFYFPFISTGQDFTWQLLCRNGFVIGTTKWNKDEHVVGIER